MTKQCKTEGCENPARPKSASGKGIAPSYCLKCRPHAPHVTDPKPSGEGPRGRKADYAPPSRIPAPDVQLDAIKRARQHTELVRAFVIADARLSSALALHARLVMLGEYEQASLCLVEVNEGVRAIESVANSLKRVPREDS